MKLIAKLAIGAVVIGGVIFGITQAAKASGGGGGGVRPGTNDIDPTFDPFDPGTDGPSGPGGGGGGGGGGSGGGGSTPPLGPGGFRTVGGDPQGGMIFGHISDAGLPGTWMPNGNTVRFSQDCSVVLVGRQVWTMQQEIDAGEYGGLKYSSCVEFSDVKSCWRHGQNLCCFIDYLMNQKNVSSATEIGEALLRGMTPPCIDAPSSSWPPAMRDFVQWLRAHVNEYVREAGGQADW